LTAASSFGLIAAKMLAVHGIDHAGKKWLKGQARSIHRTAVDHMRLHETVPVPADKVAFLLDGAWNAMGAAAPPALLAAVDGYVRGLLTSGAGYDEAALVTAIHGWDQP
jgi:hypothetical protein